MRLDSLPPAQVTHGGFAAEAFQHDTNLLFRGVLAPSSGLNRAYERPGRLCAFIGGRCFTCLCLGHLWLLYLKYSTSSRELTPPQISRVFLPPDRLVVQMRADADRPSRRQTYALSGKTAYVDPGDQFEASATILAGAPPALADLSTYSSLRYEPLEDLGADTSVDRYAAVKALRFRQPAGAQAVRAIESLIHREEDQRVALEAAGSGAALVPHPVETEG